MSPDDAAERPLVSGWNGRFFEDFQVGDVYRHPFGRTITGTDNRWFTHLTLNTNPIHFDQRYAAQTEFGRILVNSCFTLALVTGLSVTDVSQNAFANLGWDGIRLPHPVFEEDTIYAQSEVLDLRPSKSRPNVGIVRIRTTGYNQDGTVVIEYKRTIMVYRRGQGPSPAATVLAEFCASLRWARLPSGARERTKELVLDLLGVAARGSAEPSSRSAAAFVAEQGTGGPASVIGAGFGTSAAWAALANGTAAHAIELDDVTTESSLHPGVAVIPAALAVAEAVGSSPTQLLEAIVAGYEVTMRVGNALNPAAAYKRGFHPTGVAGVFGAAMAAGRLRGLDASGLTLALGIAGTFASGSLEYLADGSFTKRLNAGWAAHAGIVAAGLARSGFSGPSTVFEGRLGLLRAYSDEPRPERLLADLGHPLQVMRVSIKPYACCRYSHGLIDCVLALKRAHAIRPEDIASIRLGVLSGGALLVAEPIEQKRAPANVVDAQFSAPFAAAVALVHGAAGREQHVAAILGDPTVRALMARTECYRDPSLDAAYPARWPAAAEITLTDGQIVATRIEHATGEPENPVTRAGLIDKFVSLSGNLLIPDEATRLAARILRLDEEADLGGVLAALNGTKSRQG